MEYYTFNKSEFENLWANSFIVFDTNVLLSWYRYSENTVDEYNKLMMQLKDRLWIPYQIGKEYHNQRLNVIVQQIKVYQEFIVKLNEIQKELSNKNKNPFLSEELFKNLSDVLIKSENELRNRITSFEKLLNEDHYLDLISNFYEDKVGEKYSIEKIEEIKKDGAQRYKNKVPPGYMDIDKSEEEKYGDLIIWNQLIDKSKTEKKSIIFITDDRKDDWWYIKDGRTLGPRPELRKEFKNLTGENIYIYKPFKFLEYAYQTLKIAINDIAIQESKELPPFEVLKSLMGVSKLIFTIEYEKQSRESPLHAFIELFQENGYENYLTEITPLKGKIFIIIPNINDLQRRIKIKFISQIENYGLKLINDKIEIFTSSFFDNFKN